MAGLAAARELKLRGLDVLVVRWGRARVRVLAPGREWTAARAVVTLPLGVLQARAVA